MGARPAETHANGLSPTEVAAAMDGFDRSAADAQSGPTPHRFGEDSGRSMGVLPLVERLGERTARQLRRVIEPIARSRVALCTIAPTIRRHDDWLDEQPDFICCSLYTLRPVGGTGMIAVQPELVRALVDCTYGGSGMIDRSGSVQELTPTEEGLYTRLADAIMGVTASVWADTATIDPVLRSREHNPAFIVPAASDDVLIQCRFRVDFAHGDHAWVDIIYPLAAIAAIEKQVSGPTESADPRAASHWRAQMAAAARNIRLDARIVLARPELSLADVMRLAPGDVIPVTIPAHAPLIVEDQTIAFGTIGEWEGQAALMISRTETMQ